jgi:hypothetical protein
MIDVEHFSKKLDKEYTDVINKYKGEYVAFCDRGVIAHGCDIQNVRKKALYTLNWKPGNPHPAFVVRKIDEQSDPAKNMGIKEHAK